MSRFWTGLLALVLAFAARADGLPRRAPAPDAPPHTVFAWTSEGGLDYAWVAPPGLTAASKRDLVILCHGTGLDHRWGPANYPPGAFRPGDIVVSPDGPTRADNGTRLFLGRPADAEAFAAFIDEMRRVFPVRRVLLYGHSQGSFFVLYFAGERPGLIDGVVAHASGAWTWTRCPKETLNIPIVLMHGTADPVVPYGQSIGGRDWYVSQGHRMVMLRRLPRYNHWPNAVRAAECLDWCIGMRTGDPTEALAAAESLLTQKGADQYQYRCAPWFAGAAAVLDRFKSAGPRPFDNKAAPADGQIARRAETLRAAMEAHGKRHADAIRDRLPPDRTLTLDGGGWLGHLISVREDFRGVAAIEDLVAELDFDNVLKKHKAAATPLYRAWYGNGEPSAIFAAVVESLPECFLVEALPFDLASRMESWFKAAEQEGIDPAHLRGYGAVMRWRQGWDDGLKAYAEIWSAWQLPEP